MRKQSGERIERLRFMKKRFQNKNQRRRTSKMIRSNVVKARPAAEIITDWKMRRVPLRRLIDAQAAPKYSTNPAAHRRDAAPKRKSQIGEFQRILVPIDFSTHSTRALKFARALAKRNDSYVSLVHIVGPVHDLRDFAYARQRLSALAQKHLDRDLEWQPVVRSGNGPNQILQEAEETVADVIVISTRGLSQTRPSKIGSIAKQIVRYSPCPVLILPAKTSQ
jgi:nucleotide-binding universal stress UspA family protein